MPSLIEQIQAEYERDQNNLRPAVRADDIPLSYELITSEWLTNILCKGYPGAKVISHALDKPDEGSTNRCRIFLTYNQAGKIAKLPRSVFCKATHGLANRVMLGVSDCVHGEVTFFNKLRPLVDIEAPKSFLATYNPHSFNSIIVLGDLGKDTEFCKHTTKITRARAESQMTLLAKLHGRFYEGQDLDNALADVVTFEAYFHNLGDMWKKCCSAGFHAAKEVIPPRLYARHAEVWPITMKSVEINKALPRTLTHGDVHLRNWYIASSGEMGLADWQVITKGHCLRDVAYAIATSLTVADRRAWEKELLRSYLDKLQAAGGDNIKFDDAWKYYRQHLFTVLAWWTFTLAPSAGGFDAPEIVQPKDATLAFISRIATAMDDLDAFDSFN